MTDETRAFFRQHLYELVRWAMLPGARVNTAFEVQQQPGNYMTGVVVSMNADVDDDTVPPLTTAQQLALSVLLGEPDRVVLSALCDLLIEQGHEYAVECYEKGKRDGNPMAEIVKAMTPAMSQYTAAMAELGRRVAEMVAVSASVTNDAQPT